MTHTRNHVRNRTPLLIALSMTLAMAFATAQEAGLVEVDGAVLAYESSGSPDNGTVLLIAGTGMQLIDWPNELVDGLVDRGNRVIRFDNRDVGLTTMPGDFEPLDVEAITAALTAGESAPLPYDFHVMAADAVGLLDALGVDRAHVVGMSMGGAIAQLVAIDWPDRVASLTLIGADSGNPDLGEFADPEAFATVPPPPTSGDREAFTEYYVAVNLALAGSLYPADDATVRAEVDRAVERAFDPAALTRQEMVSYVGHLESAPYRLANLGNIAVPTAVLQGTDDPLVPVQSAHDIAERVPGVDLHVIDGWGHDIPVALVPEIVEVIASTVASAGP